MSSISSKKKNGGEKEGDRDEKKIPTAAVSRWGKNRTSRIGAEKKEPDPNPKNDEKARCRPARTESTVDPA